MHLTSTDHKEGVKSKQAENIPTGSTKSLKYSLIMKMRFISLNIQTEIDPSSFAHYYQNTML